MKFNKYADEYEKIVVALSGEFDSYGSMEIHPEFKNLVEDEEVRDVKINMKDVRFIDSSGIGEIVFLFKALREVRRGLELTGVHGQVKDVLELLKIDKAIPISMFS